jgi:peptidoglycan glycosyltransferase
VLADNVRRRVGGQTLYFRKYPQRGLAAHIVGYSTQVRSRAGLEASENDFLTGSNTNLSTVLDTTFDKLKGTTVQGNDLHLTLRTGAQAIALKALGGKCGAAVAIEPRTGRLLVSVSSPTYNPNLIEDHYNQAVRPKFGCGPLFNRANEGLYFPGSSFKVITASAALDSGEYTPESRFNDPGYCIEYGQKVSNFADQNGPEVFGPVDFTQALQHSINAVFCEIGMKLGARRIMESARRFGFYSVPPLETPVNERAISGLRNNGKLFFPKDDSQADPGRLAFGQGPGNAEPKVTPFQMAMVAAAVANGGIVMRPYVVERVVAPDGSTVTKTKPESLGRAISENTAAEVTTMMEAVVQGGTGTAAQIPGVRVAGKTGTAENGPNQPNTTWFICFAPADNPRVAVAVALERQSGTGGTTAAPIAKQIMEALLP